MNFVVGQRNMVLEYYIPFLQLYLLMISANLGSNELLQISYGIIGATLYSNFSSKTVICYNLDEWHCDYECGLRPPKNRDVSACILLPKRDQIPIESLNAF